MSSDYIGQLDGSFPSIKATRVRYVVNDKVKTQVIDTKQDKVIREIPHELSSNLLMDIYG